MWIERQLFQKTTKLLPIKLHIFMQIWISMLLVIGQKKSLKRNQLEIKLRVSLRLRYFFIGSIFLKKKNSNVDIYDIDL